MDVAESHPIVDPYQLFESLRLIIERAEHGGVPRSMILPLFEASEKIMREIAQSHKEGKRPATPERRNDLRLQPSATAIAISGENRFPVQILDLGMHGFGIYSGTAAPSGSFLILEIPNSDGIDSFSCFVAFCREKDGGYRMGLRIFAKLPST